MHRHCLLMIAALACGGPARAQDARQILLESLDPKASTYVGEQVTEQSGGARPETRQRQQVYRKGNILRIDFANGPVIFDDGKQQLHYFRRQKIVEQGPSNLSPARSEALRRALRNGRAIVEQLPDDSVAGRPAYVVSVRMRARQGAVRKIWIDKHTSLQLRQDITQPTGRRLSTYFTRIDFNQEPPAEKLTFTPPPDTLYVNQGPGRPLAPAAAMRLARAWGGLRAPRHLPRDFKLRGYYRHNFQGRPGVVAVYDGPGEGNTLSVFQGPVMGMAGRSEKPGRLRVLTARKGSADVILVGSIAEGELQRVMDSVD